MWALYQGKKTMFYARLNKKELGVLRQQNNMLSLCFLKMSVTAMG